MKISSPYRIAFTLVELLVAMVIAGILSSMVAIALSGAQRQAQETRAASLIDRLNLLVLQLYEDESQRRADLTGNGSPLDRFSASQTRLVWARDWLRINLPDCKEDIDAGSGRPGAPGMGSVLFVDDVPGPHFVGVTERNSALWRYRQRIARMVGVTAPGLAGWTAAFSLWTEENESAECLYLILATSNVNGQPALQQLRDRDIADTDEDGMPEIVDPWGVPVLWMREPAGFYLKNRWSPDETNDRFHPTVGELRDTISRLGPDPLDILRCDPRFGLEDDDLATDKIDTRDPSPGIEIHQFTFFCRPLVVSAGQDGEFDLVTKQRLAGQDPNNTINTLRKTTANNSVATLRTFSRPNAGTSGPAYPSALGPFYYPDPFDSLAVNLSPVPAAPVNPQSPEPALPNQTGIVPLMCRQGAVVDTNFDDEDNSADNVYSGLGAL